MFVSIKIKMLFVVAVLISLMMFAVIFISKKNFEMEMKSIHGKLAQNALQSAMYIIKDKYDEAKDSGVLSMTDELENIFFSLKFAETGYFFMFDGKGNMLIHPKIAGKNLSDMTDILASESLIQQLTAAAKAPEKPVEHLSLFSGKHTHLTYVDYFKAADWYVAVSIPDEAISVPLRRFIIRERLVILMILFAGIIIVISLSEKIANPLLKLARYATELPKKNFTAEDAQMLLSLKSDNINKEIGQIIESFMFMEDTLRKFHEELERRVEKRTSELNDTNEQLKKEFAERRQSEISLRCEQKLFHEGPVVMFRWGMSENGRVRYVSPNITQFGYQPEDFLSGKIRFAEIIHPDDRERTWSEIQKFIAVRAEFEELDYRIIRADGEVRWVYDFTKVFYDAPETFRHGYIFDITERKQNEVALQESQA